MRIPRSIQQQVRDQAKGLCEYSHLPDTLTMFPFQIDHIIAGKHGGPTILENLAHCCMHCNLAKADKVSGIDPVTGAEVALFNPRTQAWEAHFGWSDDQQTIEGRTLTGRATIVTLDMNSELRRGARLLWFMMGLLP